MADGISSAYLIVKRRIIVLAIRYTYGIPSAIALPSFMVQVTHRPEDGSLLTAETSRFRIIL
jgi:hypothetical protein